MDALEAQKDRVYVAPALNILYSSWLVAEKEQCTSPQMHIFAHTDSNFACCCSRFREIICTKIQAGTRYMRCCLEGDEETRHQNSSRG